jgi:hypothetical protein
LLLHLPGGNPAGHAENDAADVESKGALESEGVQQITTVGMYKMCPCTQMYGKRKLPCVFNL